MLSGNMRKPSKKLTYCRYQTHWRNKGVLTTQLLNLHVSSGKIHLQPASA